MKAKTDPRLIHRLVGFASGIPLGRKKQAQMIHLMVEAIDAGKQELKVLEKQAANILSGFTSKLRKAKRAPISKAALDWDSNMLKDAARRRRSAYNAKKSSPKKDIPTAQYQEHTGPVDLVGKGGYSRLTDITELLNLTKEQRKRAREFVGRPLGKLTLRDAKGNVQRVVDLAAMWKQAAERSAAAKRAMDVVKKLMASSDAKLHASKQFLRQADSANLAHNKSLENMLRQNAERAAEEANILRKKAAVQGDKAYKNVRNIFWRDVRADVQLCEHIESMGLTFNMSGNERVGAPYFKIGNFKERMTMEHFRRKSDDPRKAIDRENLIVSESTENSLLNEPIRKHDLFQRDGAAQ
jgi:hypothetical protein